MEPALSVILQRRATRGSVDEAMPEQARSAIFKASGPEILTKEIAPVPSGVATAAMVGIGAEAIRRAILIRSRGTFTTKVEKFPADKAVDHEDRTFLVFTPFQLQSSGAGYGLAVLGTAPIDD